MSRVVILLVAAALGQAAPPRDLRVEASGTGVISGIVQSDDAERRPLRRATVRLASGALMTARMAFTGEDGRFEFKGLPAGQYTVSATRPTFMGAEYGARRPGGSGSAIVLGNGERFTNATLRLGRYGSISGVIYDQNGEPVQGISVEALRYTMRTGRRTLSNVYGQPSFTDDRGVYRFGGLIAGQYYVAAGPSPDRGPRDLQVLTPGDIDRVLQNLKTSADAIAPVAFAQPHQGFAPIFYPGSPVLARAQPIVLAYGEDRAGIDLRLQLLPTARILGTVTTPDGRPAPAAQIVASAVTEAFTMDLFSAGDLGTAPVDKEGRFAFPAAPPGRYVITARTPASAGAEPFWALADVSVNAADQNVSLVLQPGMSVSGRVVFDGTSAPPNMTAVRLGLRPAGDSAVSISIGVPAAMVESDGSFRFTGASPGRYILAASGVPATSGWVLRSALVNGVDALDAPLSIEPGRDIDKVVMTFTDRPTELSGVLQTPVGDPTADYFIIVFSTDRAHWIPSTRRSTTARPASTGRYLVRNLPPGEYCVAAVTDIEQGAWFDPEFLASLLVASPLRITFTEGERKTLDLRVGK